MQSLLLNFTITKEKGIQSNGYTFYCFIIQLQQSKGSTVSVLLWVILAEL